MSLEAAMTRRFVTREDIEDAAAKGQTVLEVDEASVLTDLARERAQDLHIRITRLGRTSAPADDGPELHARVRGRVLAAVGHEPADLDAVIDAVIARTQS